MCTKSLLLSSLIIASRLAIFSGSLPITFCRRKTLKTSQLSWCVHAHRLGYILRRHSLNSVDPYSLVHCWGYSTESKMDRYESWLTGSCCDQSFVATVASVWNEETGWYWMIVHLWFKLHFCKWITIEKILSLAVSFPTHSLSNWKSSLNPWDQKSDQWTSQQL